MTPKDSERYCSLRVNTLVAVVLIKVLYLVKYTILLAEQGLYTVISSNVLLFYECFNKEDGPVM